jgi:hypothetical protein
MKPSPAVLSASVQDVQAMTLSNPMGWVYAFSFASAFWVMFAMLVFAMTHPPLIG